jgi:hypothetical protein
MQGLLENTEKDRVRRLIRLKPPVEPWFPCVFYAVYCCNSNPIPFTFIGESSEFASALCICKTITRSSEACVWHLHKIAYDPWICCVVARVMPHCISATAVDTLWISPLYLRGLVPTISGSQHADIILTLESVFCLYVEQCPWERKFRVSCIAHSFQGIWDTSKVHIYPAGLQFSL